MKRRGYVPQTASEIANQLNLKGGRRTKFYEEIKALLRNGIIVKLKKDRLCLPADADLISGIIKFRQSGTALLIPDSQSEKEQRSPINIKAEDTWVAMHGDHVLARKTNLSTRNNRNHRKRKAHLLPEAATENCRVIRILERGRETITGTLKRSHLYYFIIPDDPRIIQDILVHDPKRSGIKPVPKINDKVVVRLTEWQQRHLNPEGKITEILGRTHEPWAEQKAILRLYDLNPHFRDEVMREIDKIPKKVTPAQRRGRIDLRKLLTFTIDPDDAKDFDDALSIELLSNGNRRIGVHIADVSAYVRPSSALDKEAQRRGNSTYLVGQVVPMLPAALSNGVCSLVEGEDRLTKTVFFTFSNKSQLRKTSFANTLICSRKRMTYHQALGLLKENNFNTIRKIPLPPTHLTGSTGRSFAKLADSELKDLQIPIRELWKIGAALRARRFAKGSLDFDMPEIKIFVDKKGYADRLESIAYDESHQLIEEFMLAANGEVAKSLRRAGVPLLYRVHDKPDPVKLEEFRELLATYGLETGNLNQRKEIVSLLPKLKDHPQGHTLRIQFLRSLKQACYRAEPHGHFGLNLVDYTHFTSPIRRYSDLVVHRILDSHIAPDINSESPKNRNANYSKGRLIGIAQHISLTEQNSTEAERASVKVKLMEFFERELSKKKKTIFDAYIVDLKNHGFFIELTPSMAFGLVHISTLRDDLYTLNSDSTVLIGRRKKKKYTLGQKVKVVVDRIDRFKRQIDFRIA